jgi:hypothetical protein
MNIKIDWMPVPNFDGRYYVDKKANIYSVRKGKLNTLIIRRRKQIHTDYLGRKYTYLKDKQTDLSTRFDISKYLQSLNDS